MKGRWFAGAVVGATVVLALALAATAAETGATQVKIVKMTKPAHAESESGAWLGVSLQDVSTGVARAMGLNAKEGALIADVEDGSPADDIGLKNGDVIMKFNGKNVGSASDLTAMVRDADPGSKASLSVVRDGKAMKFQVVLGDLADRKSGDDEETTESGDYGNDNGGSGNGGNNGNAWYGKGQGDGDRQVRIFRMRVSGAYLGVELQNLTEQLGDFFGVKDGKGALISRVVEDSPAAAAGLKAGDVITKVGDEAVDDPSDVTEQLGDLKPGDSVNITYVGGRGSSENTVTVKLAKRPAGQNRKMMMLGDSGEMPNVDLRELRQLPGMRQHLQGWSMPNSPAVPGVERQRLREQMQELRDQMQQLRDQLEEMRDQMHSEKDSNR